MIFLQIRTQHYYRRIFLLEEFSFGYLEGVTRRARVLTTDNLVKNSSLLCRGSRRYTVEPICFKILISKSQVEFKVYFGSSG